MAPRADDARLVAVLGPTNTGKTHLAIERMLARESGVIGAPLRLLAREIYDRIVAVKGEAAAGLITGEEKITPPGARYFACTVEAMPLDRRAAFVAVDEVQLAADPERGHVFTDRLLNARGREETMLLGAETMRPLIRALAPKAEHERRERYSKLSYAGAAKLSKLPGRTAIVAFSAEEVYAIAELLQRQRGGAAVVMGALSPRTRNAQVELYQSGEVAFLVATDAIGMGLNLDVDHVAFASLEKFDGRRRRPLRPQEIGQIAGRAGRFRSDGTFGVTGSARPMPQDVIDRVEAHEFEAVRVAQWRSSALDFSSIERLIASLRAPPPDARLQRAREAADEVALKALAEDDDIAPRARGRDAVRRLWDACQLPDFRKVTIDQHVRLTAAIARHLLGPRGRIPPEWIGAEVAKLDKPAGEVDALASRLAHMRTWTYVANRADWVEDPAHWRGLTRDIEDRLSDALHDALTRRFVDRRTSALMRGLNADAALDSELGADGEVSVEGHAIGRLAGLSFQPAEQGGSLEAKALRAAAIQALRPEIDRRLGAIARADDDAFSLGDDFAVRWAGHRIARLAAGPTPLEPSATLIGGEIGASAGRARAERRVEAWLRALIAAELRPLMALSDAVRGGALTGLARGLAYRLVESLGSLDRADAAEEVRALSAAERRALRALGVKFAEHDVFMPALLKPKPARLLALLRAAGPDGGRRRPFLPAPGRVSMTIDRGRAGVEYRAAGYRACGRMAVRLDIVERLSELARAAHVEGAAGFPATAEMLAATGCTRDELAGVLRALGFRRVKPRPAPESSPETSPETGPETAPETSSEAAEAAPPAPPAELWRASPRARRRNDPARAPAPPPADSPFAALAALRDDAAPPPRRRRKPKRSS